MSNPAATAISSVRAIPFAIPSKTLTVENKPSVVKKIWDTTVKQFQTVGGFKNFAKAPATYLGAFGKFFTLTPFTTALRDGSALMKDGLAWAALPTNVHELYGQLKKTVHVFKTGSESKTDAIVDTFWKINAFSPTINDGIKFLTNAKVGILNISKQALTKLGTINNASLLLFASDQTRRNVCKVADEKTIHSDSPKLVKKTMNRITHHMLNVATHVSYVALALFGLIGLFVAGVPAWGIPVCSALALTFTFAAIYFKGVKESSTKPYMSLSATDFAKTFTANTAPAA